MRKCKCKLCKSDLTTDKAYKVSNGKVNSYYCSKEEHDNYIKELEQKQKCLETISRIMRIPLITPVMKKEINMINQFYSYIIIEKTFIECENSISWFLENKEQSSEYAKTKYISTIIQNNINNVYKKYIQEQKEIAKLFNSTNSIDMDIINKDSHNQNNTNKSDISEFL